MARRWTIKEEKARRIELLELYVKENKTISEVALFLNIKESTVYDRLMRLGIASERHRKLRCNNQRTDITLPNLSRHLAEFIGIMLGDGHISKTQVTVTLGKKDEYVEYVSGLIEKLFKIKPRTSIRGNSDYVIYFGSTKAVKWLQDMGLMFNKVRGQVNIPNWIFSSNNFMRYALRGLVDTDGSVYKIKFGIQISFTNYSMPLLIGAHSMFRKLNFKPSKISGVRFYLTQRQDIDRFVKEIGFGNRKHLKRFLRFKSENGRVA